MQFILYNRSVFRGSREVRRHVPADMTNPLQLQTVGRFETPGSDTRPRRKEAVCGGRAWVSPLPLPAQI